MKIIVSVLMAAALMACGGKTKKTATPDNQTGTTTEPTDLGGTGGTTYGGSGDTTATPAADGTADPGAGN